VNQFLADAGHANSLTVGTNGIFMAASQHTGKIIRYDAAGKGTLVAKNIRAQYVLARPDGATLCHYRGRAPR